MSPEDGPLPVPICPREHSRSGGWRAAAGLSCAWGLEGDWIHKMGFLALATVEVVIWFSDPG